MKKYEGRFWKKSFYTQEVSGPFGFMVEADSPKEALEKAIKLMFQIEANLTTSVIERSELLINGKWKEFGPEGFKKES
jgi:hypothetical protein